MSDELIHKSEMQKWIESKARKPKMSYDLISRQAAIEAIRNEREWLDENIQNPQHHYHIMNETTRILSIIGNLPSVQPETGQWVKYPDCGCFKCSECGTPSLNRFRYCHGCGAKMEERWSK